MGKNNSTIKGKKTASVRKIRAKSKNKKPIIYTRGPYKKKSNNKFHPKKKKDDILPFDDSWENDLKKIQHRHYITMEDAHTLSEIFDEEEQDGEVEVFPPQHHFNVNSCEAGQYVHELRCSAKQEQIRENHVVAAVGSILTPLAHSTQPVCIPSDLTKIKLPNRCTRSKGDRNTPEPVELSRSMPMRISEFVKTTRCMDMDTDPYATVDEMVASEKNIHLHKPLPRLPKKRGRKPKGGNTSRPISKPNVVSVDAKPKRRGRPRKSCALQSISCTP